MKNSREKNTFWVLIVLSGLFLLSNTVRPVSNIRRVAVNILFPVSEIIKYPFDSIRVFGERGRTLSDLYKAHSLLKKEKERLTREFRDVKAVLDEYNAFRKIFDFEDFIPAEAVAARVSVHTPENYFDEFVINRGRADGIKKNDAVVKIMGRRRVLIGRVNETFENSSKVLLLTSTEFRAGGITGGNVRGVIAGNGGWDIQFDYVPPGSDIRTGCEIYTCGTGGIFPGGLAVGTAMEIKTREFSMGKTVSVRPFIYPQNARYVHVIKIGSLVKEHSQ